MVVRIENAGLVRGREFSLYAYAKSEVAARLYAFNPVSRDYEELSCEYVRKGDFHIFNAIAPHYDGYLLAKVGRQRLAKRIGIPVVQALIYGYKEGYLVPYKLYDAMSNVIDEGKMAHIVDGFYYAMLPSEAMMAELGDKKILISRNIAKLGYQVRIEGGKLASSLSGASLPDVELPDVDMGDATLPEVRLASELPEVEIKEL